MLFDLKTLSLKDRHKLMISVITPRPIAWIVSRSPSGQLNAAPFSFFNIVSDEPPLIGISIGGAERGEADYKDTSRNIRDTGEFVVNIVSRSMTEAMVQTAVDFPPRINELDIAGLSTLPSASVNPPRIAGCPAALECRRERILDFPNHRQFVIGEIIAIHVADEAVLDPDRCYVDTPKFDAIGRMHGAGWYTQMSDWFQVRTPPRPPE